MTGRRVAVVTAARNEAAKIARTIESVVAQEHRPDRWVIASDGSTDETVAKWTIWLRREQRAKLRALLTRANLARRLKNR